LQIGQHAGGRVVVLRPVDAGPAIENVCAGAADRVRPGVAAQIVIEV